MALRDIAAAHRKAILAQPLGVGEDIVHIHGTTAVETPGRGQWAERPSDARDPIGIGVQAFIGDANVVVGTDFAACTRADSIRRVATGEVWSIDDIVPTPGVGRKLILAKPGRGQARGY